LIAKCLGEGTQAEIEIENGEEDDYDDYYYDNEPGMSFKNWICGHIGYIVKTLGG